MQQGDVAICLMHLQPRPDCIDSVQIPICCTIGRKRLIREWEGEERGKGEREKSE